MKSSKNNIGTQPEKDDQLVEKMVEKKDKPVWLYQFILASYLYEYGQ